MKQKDKLKLQKIIHADLERRKRLDSSPLILKFRKIRMLVLKKSPIV